MSRRGVQRADFLPRSGGAYDETGGDDYPLAIQIYDGTHDVDEQEYGWHDAWFRGGAKGKWITIDYRIEPNSPGEADGVMEGWVNGNPAYHCDDLLFLMRITVTSASTSGTGTSILAAAGDRRRKIVCMYGTSRSGRRTLPSAEKLEDYRHHYEAESDVRVERRFFRARCTHQLCYPSLPCLLPDNIPPSVVS